MVEESVGEMQKKFSLDKLVRDSFGKVMYRVYRDQGTEMASTRVEICKDGRRKATGHSGITELGTLVSSYSITAPTCRNLFTRMITDLANDRSVCVQIFGNDKSYRICDSLGEFHDIKVVVSNSEDYPLARSFAEEYERKYQKSALVERNF